jgi:low temperature requirement protein LtrA
MNKKSKVGFGNLLVTIGVIFIILGIMYSVSVGLDDGWQTSFLCCLFGTILTFVGGYLKEGYFKFFN